MQVTSLDTKLERNKYNELTIMASYVQQSVLINHLNMYLNKNLSISNEKDYRSSFKIYSDLIKLRRRFEILYL